MNTLIDHLRGHGDRPAVHTAETTLTYRALAGRVATAAAEFGSARKLIMLQTRNDITTLTYYLGALAGGHVVIPVPAGGDHAEVLDTYRPDIVIDADGVHQHDGPAHDLHPELVLLMSTSGSTGSPKLVRLSAANLISNARSIAEYLDIRETDCAATTLPMSYCYGLSVIHSHLLRGAALILTDLSVIEDGFWELFEEHRGTTFAGVPYTFDLLDRIGFASLDLPHLRYLTQAGGALGPQRIREFAELGARRGWQLYVMYGATEATARMAYLPPDLARSRPQAIGLPIPGGQLRIEPSDVLDDQPAGVGELVYSGPNVMMGYAESVADLAAGPGADELRTGDLARQGPDGLFEIVGRVSRFAKLFGLRIDLQRLEATLGAQGLAVLSAATEDTLVVATTGSVAAARAAVSQSTGLPAGAVQAVAVDTLPMLPSGKPDYPAVRALHTEARSGTPLRTLYADVLHLDADTINPDASFVDLGGNSLTYVSLSARLERALGRLPAGWHLMPLRELQRLQPRRRRWLATLDTGVVLRAIAIIAIVGSHAELFELWGGAHILLGVAGYNFGRFCLTAAPRTVRVRRLGNTIGWIAVPAIAWVALTMTFTDDYRWTNLLLANKFLGPFDSMTAGRLWFIEVLVWTLVGLTLLLACAPVDRLERRHQFAFAAVFLAVGLAVRYTVTGQDAWFSMAAFWFFALGWAAEKASTRWQRAALTVVAAVGLYGYFADPFREALVFGGLALLIWVPTLRCPLPLAGVSAVLADASLYIYLTHFQIYPLFGTHRLVGVLVALLVGVALAQSVNRLRRRIGHRSAASPSWTMVAATTPSARTNDAVTTPRPSAAAGDRDSRRFH